MNVFFKKGLVGLIIFMVAFFVANQFLFFERGLLEHVTSNVTYPFIWAASGVSNFIQRIVERRESYEQLKSDLKLLQEKYELLYDENLKFKAVSKFDLDSKEIREFKERYNLDKMLLAKVLIRNLKQDGQFFLINRGANCGIKKNMVGIYKYQLLGKITEVHDYYSKLTLITDVACKVAAYTSSTNAKGIVIGENNVNRCKMYYVSHLLDVADNDVVISSGQGLVFPEGFCIGKIVKHFHSHDTLYHNIELEPSINLKSIKYCLLTDLSQTCSLKFDLLDLDKELTSSQDGLLQDNSKHENSKKE